MCSAATSPRRSPTCGSIDWVWSRDQFRHRLRAGHARSGCWADPACGNVYVQSRTKKRTALVGQMAERYPNVSAIPVREALATRSSGWIADDRRDAPPHRADDAAGRRAGAGRRGRRRHYRRRVYDAVVLKVLGATGGTIASLASSSSTGLMGLVDQAIGDRSEVHAYRLVASLTGPLRQGLGSLAPARSLARARARLGGRDDGRRLRRRLAGARRQTRPTATQLNNERRQRITLARFGKAPSALGCH